MYSQKAFEILNSSINSVIFIDEKAKDFFSGTPVDSQIPEETLSENLYKAFKNKGKSLDVHRFEPTDIENPEILKYLFNNRDLILLDWELDAFGGQEYSLKLLHKAVETPYINFCCIYSSSSNFSNISLYLDAYFMGVTSVEFESIKNGYNYIDVDEIQKVFGKNKSEIDAFLEENRIDTSSFPIIRLREKSEVDLLRIIYISLTFDSYIIPENVVKYEVINTENDSFIINNTFVFTLKKDVSSDNNCQSLLERISQTVIKNEASFFQLLGLEMQSIFNSNERFIDETILKSSTEALFQFRNHINDDKAFGTIIKKLLIEQATLKLRTAKLKLLESDFLNTRSKELQNKKPSDKDLLQLNVFYNSVSVGSLNLGDIPNLNFGDIFKGEGTDYYLCITALCDCAYPKEGNFYFAKGDEFEDLELALRLGDTAFLSFLPNQKVVQWGDVEKLKIEKIKKKPEETDEQFDYRKLQAEVASYKKFLHKPFFIKPKVYNVANNKLIDNKIQIWDITNNFKQIPNGQDLNYYDVEYITTLRNDYTQRIANHAFGHPSRVGVDFVKLK